MSKLRIAGPEAFEAAPARKKAVAGPVREQGSMYHICPPQCQIQLGRAKSLDNGNALGLRAGPAPSRRGDLGHPVRAGIGRVDECDDGRPSQRRFHFGETPRHRSGLMRNRQDVQGRASRARARRPIGRNELVTQSPQLGRGLFGNYKRDGTGCSKS